MISGCSSCIYFDNEMDTAPCNTCDENYSSWVGTSFPDRIRAMNTTYGLAVCNVPTLHEDHVQRLQNFKVILDKEVKEIDDIPENGDIDTLVALADLLGDMTVYCRSEAMKWGIPLEAVLDIIMDSNESKTGGGKDEYGKFLKGPNYWKPEPKIKELLLQLMGHK